MRTLARFIMRGRMQAGITALVGSITSVPLVTPATVALVTLRHGLTAGLQVLAWGLLPAIVFLALQQPSALLAISGMLTVYVAAAVLRKTASWSQALMGLVACSLLGALLVALFAPLFVAAFEQIITKFFDGLQAQQPLGLPVPDTTLIVGLVASMIAYGAAGGLVLARWWQSVLYNPEGFASEFQRLRLTQIQAFCCAGAVIYSLLQSPSYSIWAQVFALPLLLAGIALVHAVAAKKRLATPWLVFFYAALVLIQPFMQLLIVVAFFDVWLDFRKRLAAN